MYVSNCSSQSLFFCPLLLWAFLYSPCQPEVFSLTLTSVFPRYPLSLSLFRYPFFSSSVSYNVSPCLIPVVTFFLTVSPCCLIYSTFPLCPTFFLFMSSLLYVFPSVVSFFLFVSLPLSMPSLSSPPFVYLSVCISLSLCVSHSNTLFIRPKPLSFSIFSSIFSSLCLPRSVTSSMSACFIS